MITKLERITDGHTAAHRKQHAYLGVFSTILYCSNHYKYDFNGVYYLAWLLVLLVLRKIFTDAMVMTVLGCGQSAEGWIRRGTVIGSNDVLKFGKDVDILILANHPRKFGDRLKTIKKTQAKVMVTSRQQWQNIFPNCEKITRITSFNKMLVKGYVYTSTTTPIMCLSLAIRLGATKIVMYGVDLLSHHTYSSGTKAGDKEIATYLRFFAACKKLNIEIYRGANGSVFDNHLPLWIETVS